MYFVILLKNGKIIDFDEKCNEYSISDAGFVTLKAENGNTLAVISMDYIYAIILSDCLDVYRDLLPVPD